LGNTSSFFYLFSKSFCSVSLTYEADYDYDFRENNKRSGLRSNRIVNSVSGAALFGQHGLLGAYLIAGRQPDQIHAGGQV
jgi:hypothetical protein